ncbi:hypothetical protein [Mycetocola reblochoni]
MKHPLAENVTSGHGLFLFVQGTSAVRVRVDEDAQHLARDGEANSGP